MQELNESENRSKFSANAKRALAAMAVVVVLVVVVRLRLLEIPLERDEGEYAYAGQLMLQGIPPYKLAFNMKLPGTYLSYAAMMKLFGETIGGIHFGFLVVNLATLALMFFVTRRLLDFEHAIVATMCYALLSICPGVLGLEGHATQLVVLAALGGILLLLKARKSGSVWTFGWSGVGFGLSFVCKQPGLFFGMFAGAVLLRDTLAAPAAERGARLRNMGIFCAGVALPFLLTCVWMGIAGTFDRFWFWTIVYARAHAGLLTWRDGLVDIKSFYKGSGALKWSWLAAAAGLVCLLWDKARSEARFVIVCLLGFSLIAFTASFYFSAHYFIMLLPAVSLLVAVAARRAAREAGEVGGAVLVGLACAAFIFANHAMWFQATPRAVCRTLYGGNPFNQAVSIGHYIESHTAPGDTIAILGSEPEVFFYAHRHSATAYIYMYDLMQGHRYALDMQKEAIRDIEAAKPAYLLKVYVDSSWTISEDSNMTFFDWARGYVTNHYELAGIAWILPDRTQYVWGPEAATKTFDTPFSVDIMKRKPGK